MDGKAYVEAFRPTPVPDGNVYNAARDAYQHDDGSLYLEGMVRSLYSDQEIHFLDDPIPPRATILAEKWQDENLKRSYLSRFVMLVLLANTINRYGYTFDLDRPHAAAKLPPNHQEPKEPEALTPDLMMESVNRDKKVTHKVLMNFSTDLMASTLLNISNNERNIPAGEHVAQAISTKRSQLAEDLLHVRGTVTLERHIDPYGREIKMRVTSDRPGKLKTPDWLLATEEWVEPLQRLLANIQEIDMLVALFEYVADRKLPYLPVFSPDIFENGKYSRQKSEASKNLHSDIMLCNLQGNEIIPVNAKHRIYPGNNGVYDPGVVLINQQHLGMVSLKTGSYYDPRYGTNRTGYITQTHYGAIHTTWTEAYERPRNAKKLQQLREMLDPAFKHFDSVMEEYAVHAGTR